MFGIIKIYLLLYLFQKHTTVTLTFLNSKKTHNLKLQWQKRTRVLLVVLWGGKNEVQKKIFLRLFYVNTNF